MVIIIKENFSKGKDMEKEHFLIRLTKLFKKLSGGMIRLKDKGFLSGLMEYNGRVIGMKIKLKVKGSTRIETRQLRQEKVLGSYYYILIFDN